MSLSQSLNVLKGRGAGKSGNKNDKVTSMKKTLNLLSTKSNVNSSKLPIIPNQQQLNNNLQSACSFQPPNDLSIFNSQLAHQQPLKPQFKVEQQKDSQYIVMATNLSMKNSGDFMNQSYDKKFDKSLESSTRFLDSANHSHLQLNTKSNQDKFKLNKELRDFGENLTKLKNELERMVNGRQNEIDLSIKQGILNPLNHMQKCLTQDYVQFDSNQFNNSNRNEDEDGGSLNNELNAIYNPLKSFNLFNEQGLNLIKNLNSNQEFKNIFLNTSGLDEKFNLGSFASLNSPVSISSPTTSLNNQTEDDNLLSSTALNNLSTNQFNQDDQQLNNLSINDRPAQLATGDQFIIDNRTNINQNRIKSSILGAAKHLSKKQKLDLDLNNNNTAINLSIHSTATEQQQKTKVKKCHCEICGQTFTQRNSLNRHLRGHSGERPFPCKFEECKKSFSDKQRLLIHMRIHTGDRPFSCSLCGRSFTQKSTVKRHLIVHFGSSNQAGSASPDFNNAADLKKRTKTRRPRRSKMSRKANSNQTADHSKSNQLNQLKDEPKNED